MMFFVRDYFGLYYMPIFSICRVDVRYSLYGDVSIETKKLKNCKGECVLSINSNNSFVAIYSSQSVYIEESLNEMVVSPYVVYVSDAKKIRLRPCVKSESIILMVISKEVYGEHSSLILKTMLEKRQVNLYEFKDVCNEIKKRASQSVVILKQYLLFIIHALPIIIDMEKCASSKGTTFERIRNVIVNNAHNPDLYLDEVANKCFCSRRTVQNILSKNGTSFSELTNEIRIELFCKNLLSSHHSIEELSSKSGFNSKSYAIKLFKSVMGITPSRYRRQFINERRFRVTL